MDKLTQRKNIRLQNYDYTQAGYYFVTICTKDRQELLSNIVGGSFHADPEKRQELLSKVVGVGFHADPEKRQESSSKIVGGGFHAAPNIELTPIGNEIEKTINFIDNQYSDVFIDKYIIMPNHIHLIIILQGSQSGGHGNPPLHRIVGQLKSFVSKRYNEINKTKDQILWQRNYYEHIIRSEKEYQEIWEYIETNPLKWEEDEYYK